MRRTTASPKAPQLEDEDRQHTGPSELPLERRAPLADRGGGGHYNRIATMPQLPDDDARYRANSEYEKAHPECLIQNVFGYQTTDPAAEYWTTRDLAAQAKGTTTLPDSATTFTLGR